MSRHVKQWGGTGATGVIMHMDAKQEATQLEFAKHLLLTLTDYIKGTVSAREVDRSVEGWLVIREAARHE